MAEIVGVGGLVSKIGTDVLRRLFRHAPVVSGFRVPHPAIPHPALLAAAGRSGCEFRHVS
jgi:hypothetical protein